MKVRILQYFFIFLSIPIFGKDSMINSPEDLIKSIYSNHSEKKPIDLCNQKSTRSYFDKKLFQLISKDCKCRIKIGEICKLNYDPFVGGQDFLKPNIQPIIKKISVTTFEVKIYESNPLILIYNINYF